jgi:tRNA threonylcarbamoyladenosine biosynthesis protein TsaE
MIESSWFLPDEAATVAAGSCLSQAIAADSQLPALVIYLQGNLGAGKTTFCRGVLQGLGHTGSVKSPTYTLVEPYVLPTGAVYHFDLYRLRDPSELEYLGVEDYFDEGFLCLMEWPDRGQGMIPPADIQLSLRTDGEGRGLLLEGISARGKKVATAFSLSAK